MAPVDLDESASDSPNRNPIDRKHLSTYKQRGKTWTKCLPDRLHFPAT